MRQHIFRSTEEDTQSIGSLQFILFYCTAFIVILLYSKQTCEALRVEREFK